MHDSKLTTQVRVIGEKDPRLRSYPRQGVVEEGTSHVDWEHWVNSSMTFTLIQEKKM
jgi:hypothetical protein